MTRATATLHVRDAEGKLREERREVTVLGQGRDGCIIVMVDGERRARPIHAAWLDTLPLHTRPEPTERLTSDDARESRMRHNAERLAAMETRRQARAFARDGAPATRISSELSVPERTVYRWVSGSPGDKERFASMSEAQKADTVYRLSDEGMSAGAIASALGVRTSMVSGRLRMRRAMEMLQTGMSYREVGAAVGIAHTTVAWWADKSLRGKA